MIIKKYFLYPLLLACSFTVQGDDIDILVGEAAGRAQVLIIFDNSGSMDTIVEADKPAYDPATTYPTIGSIQSNRIYWSSGNTPPSTGTSQWFSNSANKCADSLAALSATGKYQGSIRGWDPSLLSIFSDWERLSAFDRSDHVDCQEDVINNDSDNNGAAPGFPRDGKSGPYTANVADSNASWSSSNRVLYSANYMNWYHNDSLAPEDRMRIEIAKEVIKDMVLSASNVDFGLMVFNNGRGPGEGKGNKDGGRLVKKIEEMDFNDRVAFNNTIDTLLPENWTPLSETLYESFLYITGDNVLFGNRDSSGTPGRDLTAESGGKYIAPEQSCGDYLSIIYMTDGEPSKDTNANKLIENLTGETCPSFNGSKNCLPTLAKYMANDINANNSLDYRSVKVYTIGFQTDQELLRTTADEDHGQGEYRIADNTIELTEAFQATLNSIIVKASRFTAPSIATNLFNRTRSLNEVYLASFSPSSKPRWDGNLKKLHISEAGLFTDKNGDLAIDEDSGEIKETATTFWNNVVDGKDVNKGGAGRILSNESPLPSQRSIYINTGIGDALESFSTDNTNLTSAIFQLQDLSQLDSIINWARGVDVLDENRDGSTEDTRQWILGDAIHSKPIAINYGGLGDATVDNPDIRVVMGTNAGFLHMFESSSGKESWAFMPKEVAPIQAILYENASVSDHPYGVDATASLFMLDSDKDGTINSGDKVYIYFGLRRGGNALYGMDITDPDNPKLMWKIDNSSAGFLGLGQTWSKPVVGKIPGHEGWAVIFGAGYDENKDASGIDDSPLVGTPDSVGSGMYIVDYESGELLWSATPAPGSYLNYSVIGLEDSVPAEVTPLDSDGDGLIDRIYFVDTGANIWRVDMPGKTLPSNGGNWSVFKLAELGGEVAADDRRFYHRMDVLQTKFNNVNYDALVVGSGHRAHPASTSVDDYMFMIKDTEINSSCHGNTEDCATPVPDPIDIFDLYDVTDNLIQDSSTEASIQAQMELLMNSKGWKLELENEGEKILGEPSTVDGTLVFSSFVPGQPEDDCSIGIGSQYAYAVHLHTAAAAYWGEDGDRDKGDRRTFIKGSGIFGDPGIYYGEENVTQIIGLDPEGIIQHDFKLKAYGTHWYEE